MVNTDLIIAKAAAVKKHLSRIKSKADVDLETFLSDIDIQEIVLFNLQMAIQSCIDIAAHIISDENMDVAASNNEMFYILEENAFITPDLTEKMVQAISLYNLIIYEFDKIDLKKVLNVAKKDIKDLSNFIDAISQKTKISN